MTDDKLTCRNLYKVYGPEPERALDLLEQGKSKEEIFRETGLTLGVQDVNFSVGKGEMFVVMGLSGSGKSTLIRMLNRLIDPTRGSVLVDGEEITNADAETVRQIRLNKMAMVFQHFALFPHKTVVDNVEYGLKARGVPAEQRRERAMRALEQVDLAAWADSPPKALSGGMQQRVGLARALATDPEVMLMDEPFSALDPLIRREMQEQLLKLQDELHMAVVFITHDLNEALILGDKIAIMKDGRFVQVGRPQDIVAHPADDYVSAFTQDVDRGRVFTADTVIQPAEAIDLDTETPVAALDRMESLGRDGLYAVRGGRVEGVVPYRSLAQEARNNGADLEAVLERNYPVARPEAQLFEIYEQCTSGLPLAVLDDKGALQGVIDPNDVFALLAGNDEPAPETGDGAGAAGDAPTRASA